MVQVMTMAKKPHPDKILREAFCGYFQGLLNGDDSPEKARECAEEWLLAGLNLILSGKIQDPRDFARILAVGYSVVRTKKAWDH